MSAKDSKNRIYFFFLFIFLIVVDQFLKHLLPSTLNAGVALSLLNDFSPIWISVFLGVFLIILYIFWPFKQAVIAQAIFFAGAVSNFLDRIIFAGVRDCLPFLALKNNLADYYIVLALIWIFYANYLRRPRHLSD